MSAVSGGGGAVVTKWLVVMEHVARRARGKARRWPEEIRLTAGSHEPVMELWLSVWHGERWNFSRSETILEGLLLCFLLDRGRGLDTGF